MNDSIQDSIDGSSDAVEKVKSVSLTPTITSLLKPSADYLAHELKEYLKERINNYKERKRSENIAEHLSGVYESLQNDKVNLDRPPESLEQLELFEDWVTGAQDIDPENHILSSMWRDLLRQIIEGNVRENLLIALLKELDTNDAILLLKFKEKGRYRPINKEERFYLSRLERLELIEDQIGHWVFVLPTVFVPLMYLFYNVADKFKSAEELSAGFSFITTLLPQMGVLLIATALIAVVVYRVIPNHGLSWLGEELLSHAALSDIEQATNAVEK